MSRFGAAGTIGVNGASPVQLPYPSGITAGQTLLALVFSNGSSDSFTVPGGWSSMAGLLSQGAACAANLMKKIADGSESGTLDITWTAIAKAYGIVVRFEEATDHEGVVNQNGTGTVITPPTITSLGYNRLFVNFTCFGQVNQAIPAFTGANGGVWVENWEIDDGTGTDSASYNGQSAQVPNIGSVSGGSATVGASCDWISIGLALYNSALKDPPQNVKDFRQFPKFLLAA